MIQHCKVSWLDRKFTDISCTSKLYYECNLVPILSLLLYYVLSAVTHTRIYQLVNIHFVDSRHFTSPVYYMKYFRWAFLYKVTRENGCYEDLPAFPTPPPSPYPSLLLTSHPIWVKSVKYLTINVPNFYRFPKEYHWFSDNGYVACVACAEIVFKKQRQFKIM